MSLLHSYSEYVDDDVRREAVDERRRRARLNHWCDECHGFTGPGSPCAPEEDEPEPEDEEQDEEACGKELP